MSKIEDVARAMCKRRNTAQCAAICLIHSSVGYEVHGCPEAMTVWGESATAAIKAMGGTARRSKTSVGRNAMKSLVGLWIIENSSHPHKYTALGRVADEVDVGGRANPHYLVEFERQLSQGQMPLQVIDLSDITSVCAECELPQYQFFRTEEEMRAWVALRRAARESAKVVSIHKKPFTKKEKEKSDDT